MASFIVWLTCEFLYEKYIKFCLVKLATVQSLKIMNPGNILWLWLSQDGKIVNIIVELEVVIVN